jgi:hypothetical protein
LLDQHARMTVSSVCRFLNTFDSSSHPIRKRHLSSRDFEPHLVPMKHVSDCISSDMSWLSTGLLMIGTDCSRSYHLVDYWEMDDNTFMFLISNSNLDWIEVIRSRRSTNVDRLHRIGNLTEWYLVSKFHLFRTGIALAIDIEFPFRWTTLRSRSGANMKVFATF